MAHALTDPDALERNREKARRSDALFLHECAADDVKDRLQLVNKTFSEAAIVSGFPEFWGGRFPDAKVVPDDATVPLEQGRHDLVIHAFGLHWSDDPVGQLVQSRLALKPDGLFLAVFLGGQTLHELRASLAQAETEIRGGLSPRIVPMGEIRDTGALLQRAGFALPVADNLPLEVTYQSTLHLMRDLRAMGEGNALAGRSRNFTPKSVMLRACEIYEQVFRKSDGSVPATYELIFLTGWAPDANQPKPLRPGSAKARLADHLGTSEISLND
ncbi:MAG: SAM-dependent methyltransferase [Roseovarius sp.]|nr:SAM-dependent methyltransferase [Roseovarius sp.]